MQEIGLKSLIALNYEDRKHVLKVSIKCVIFFLKMIIICFIFLFISDMPIRYLFYKPDDDFDHFHYIYNLIRDCESRVEKILCSKGQKNNFTSKDVVIKIGIAGHFHENDLNLISGGTCTE